MTEDIFRSTLGDKYTPATHEYCLANRRSAGAKKLEGWFEVGELVNHGEVMKLLARAKPVPPTPPAASAPAPKPTLTQRVSSAIRGK